MKLAVLITVHNRIEKTLRCLHCLKEAVGKLDMPVDVYLVDDASTDGTAEKIRGLFPEVVIIPGNGKLFWNRGMRLAWETAANHGNYDYYLWLNNDSYLFQDSLHVLLNHSKSKANRAIISGRTISETTKEHTYGGMTKNGRMISKTGKLESCALINGNCVLITKEVFLKVGYLDNFFTHSTGDFDYSLRANKFGFKSYVTDETIAYCEANPLPPVWCRPNSKLPFRLKNLYSPLGYNQPHKHFVFDLRHYGLKDAIKHFISLHIRAFFPKYWT